MIWFVASLVFPVLLAYTIIVHFDNEVGNSVAVFFFRICLAVGLGIGFASCAYFSWLFFVGAPGTLYRICDLAVFASFSSFGLFRLCFSRWRRAIEQESISAATGYRNIRLNLAIVAALTISSFAALAAHYREPFGDCDAWAIWNQRARYLFRAGEQWRQAFSPEFAHPDYPLLLPGVNARIWSYIGEECRWTPWFIGCLFTFATVGVLAMGVGRLRSRSQGLLAGMVLLGMIPFLKFGFSQQADVPLAFFFLAAVLPPAIYDASKRKDRGLLVLSGLAAGLAAWTKNEGLLFIPLLLAARCLVAWRCDRFKKIFKEMACLGAGALPALAIVAIQKTCLVGANDIVMGQGWNASLMRVLDLSRYWQITEAFFTFAFKIAGPYAIILPLSFLFLGAAKKGSRGRVGFPAVLTVLLLMLAGYFMVYILTPLDLHWHLMTSAIRLLLHLTPLTLLALFLYLATPEDLLAREPEAERLCENPPRRLAA